LDGHVIEHIALEIQTLAGMDTQDLQNSRPKHLGPTMLFSVIPKRTLFSPQNQPLRLPNLNRGTEYDLSDLQKMREIRERVRLGPSTGSIVEEVSRNIPDPIRNQLVQLGSMDKSMRFQATITSRPAV
jgi:cyanophycin synthetase